MTVIVGVLCKDGVVIGADSAVTFATAQLRTIEQVARKIDVVGDGKIIVAGTGAVGLGQRFTAVVEQAYGQKLFREPALEVGKKLSSAAIADFGSTSVSKGQYGALVAFPCQKQPCLCEFSVTDFQPELKTDRIWYVSMGSGQVIVDPFLGLIRRVFWKDGELPSKSDATFAITWALSHAIEVNAGGINGPKTLAVLENEKGEWCARILTDDEIAEHEASVDAAEAHLRGFATILRGEGRAGPQIPDDALGGVK